MEVAAFFGNGYFAGIRDQLGFRKKRNEFFISVSLFKKVSTFLTIANYNIPIFFTKLFVTPERIIKQIFIGVNTTQNFVRLGCKRRAFRQHRLQRLLCKQHCVGACIFQQSFCKLQARFTAYIKKRARKRNKLLKLFKRCAFFLKLIPSGLNFSFERLFVFR